jgi:hypothetical protein
MACAFSAPGCEKTSYPEPAADVVDARPTILYLADDEVREAEYELVDDHLVVDGDIALGPPADAWSEHAMLAAEASGARPKSTMDVRRRRRWDGGVIRYAFSGDDAWEEGRFERRQVEAAVSMWNSLSQITGVRWEEAPLDERQSGVRFDLTNEGRCDSEVGRKQRRFDINLAPACLLSLSPILHEMGHAAGLVHEHQRSDRDEYVRYSEANHVGRRWDLRDIDHLPRRADEIGGYDTESIMHYASLPAKDRVPAPFPCLSNRHTLSSFSTFGMSATALSSFRTRYNRFIRRDGRGVGDPRQDFRVMDVDGDGFDDLVAESGSTLVWSSRGASGWRPLEAGGEVVEASRDEIAVADFDAAPGQDVLRVRGRDWTLFSSDGAVAMVRRSMSMRDIEVADVTGDGRDDVFVVKEDGSWAYASSGDALGPLIPRAPLDMGVDDVELVSLRGEGLDVLAFVQGVLAYCPEGSVRLRPVFAGDGRGPLPEHVSRLDELWFGHVDAGRSNPDAAIDLVTWSSGNDGTGVDEGAPVFVSDFGVDPAPTLRAFEDQGGAPIWVDLRHAVAGYLVEKDLISFLTLGYIPWNGHIAESDIMALAIRYQSSGRAALTDKYPLPRSGEIHETETIRVAPNERIELEADFMAPSSLRTVVVSRERMSDEGHWTLVDARAENVSGDAVVVRDVFSADEGRWRVRAFPSDPGAAAAWDVAEWLFEVAPRAPLRGEDPAPTAERIE